MSGWSLAPTVSQRKPSSVVSARTSNPDSPPQVQPWGTEEVLRDPDGNMVVLQQA